MTEFFPKYNVFPRGVILALSFVMIAALLGGCATSFDKRGKFHRVRSGESIWTIARFYGLDLQELAEYNNIFKPGDMKAGQQLYIPEKEKKPPFKELPSDSSSRSSRRGGSKYSRADSSQSQIKTFRGKFIWPVEGRLTSPFGIRNGRRHDGIDIAAREGTPIKASAPGTAVFV
ncbi:MAG TPA: LysM peptidoglycan-binding domain-containing protein, partial [bacterium]|nr:LysM peptidoglycan-binding domain-containing protein [bacterium]